VVASVDAWDDDDPPGDTPAPELDEINA